MAGGAVPARAAGRICAGPHESPHGRPLSGAATFQSSLRQGSGTMNDNRFSIPVGTPGGSVNITGAVSGNQVAGAWSGEAGGRAAGEPCPCATDPLDRRAECR
jgi:hypothetical protein